MNGKVVLITGANGGLGTHVTRAFAEAGVAVVATSRKVLESDFRGQKLTAISADISSLDSTKKLVDQVIAKYQRLDVLVHTVGGFAGGHTVADTDNQTFQQMLDVNLNSLFHMLRATIPPIRKSGSGRIIAIGSRAAVEPGAGVGAYSASKAAMLSLMKTVAIENFDAGLTANVILPGTIDTPANRNAMPGADYSKWVQPSNIASLALWLASDAAKDVTGAALPIYGAL